MLYRIWAALPLLLAGCASPPDKIKPAEVSELAFQGADCTQLFAESRRVDKELAAVSKLQSEAATGDAVGVFLFGVPMSSLGGGDREAEVAQLKGEKEALARAAIQKGCGTQAANPVNPA